MLAVSESMVPPTVISRCADIPALGQEISTPTFNGLRGMSWLCGRFPKPGTIYLVPLLGSVTLDALPIKAVSAVPVRHLQPWSSSISGRQELYRTLVCTASIRQNGRFRAGTFGGLWSSSTCSSGLRCTALHCHHQHTISTLCCLSHTIPVSTY